MKNIMKKSVIFAIMAMFCCGSYAQVSKVPMAVKIFVRGFQQTATQMKKNNGHLFNQQRITILSARPSTLAGYRTTSSTLEIPNVNTHTKPLFSKPTVNENSSRLTDMLDEQKRTLAFCTHVTRCSLKSINSSGAIMLDTIQPNNDIIDVSEEE